LFVAQELGDVNNDHSDTWHESGGSAVLHGSETNDWKVDTVL